MKNTIANNYSSLISIADKHTTKSAQPNSNAGAKPSKSTTHSHIGWRSAQPATNLTNGSEPNDLQCLHKHITEFQRRLTETKNGPLVP